MEKHSKRFKELKNHILSGVEYDLDFAIDFLKTLATAKFCETFEVHVSLNIDPKNSSQQIRSSLILPHKFNKKQIIAVLTSESKINYALELGANIAGSDDLIEQIAKNRINFDILIATYDVSDKLSKISRILGPKGLMPSPKRGNLTKNLEQTIFEYIQGKFEYKTDKTGVIHIPFGNVNLSNEALKSNFLKIYSSLYRPIGLKGKYFKSCYICSTMSPSLKINLDSIKKYE